MKDAMRPLAGESVAIVGFSETTRGEAPWGDEENWPELWVCNRLPLQPGVTRWTRHFDPHPLSWSESHFSKELFEEYFAFLKADHGERLLYLAEDYPAIPNAVRIPVEELVRFIGRRYLTSAIAYQVALALALGAKRIGLWGIDLRHDTEYAFERPCVEWLLGIARGMGVAVFLPEASSLLNQDGATPLYGIEEEQTHLADVERMLSNRIKEIEGISETLQKKNDETLRELYLGEGARVQSELYLQAIRQARRGGKLFGAEKKS